MNENKKTTGVALTDKALDKVTGGVESYEYDKMRVASDSKCPYCGADSDWFDSCGHGPDDTIVYECTKCKEFFLKPMKNG